MKNMIKLPAIVLGLMLMLTGTAQKVMAQQDDVSLQSFYDELSPYGTWIQDPQYGYVWRPDVEQGDFRPYYTNGRWVMTEYGNTWVSNYDWGWAPFHYGRWVYNRFNQWIWIPDTVWGPAWVSWRSGGGYYGWAPMGPGMNININFNIPDLWWVFVPQRNIYYDSFPRYYSRRNVVIINRTTIINNTYVHNRRSYYTGPRADDIRRDTRQDVRVYNVNNTGRPSRSNISGNSVNIYTPRPSRGNSNANAAPREAIRGEGYTTMRDRDRSNSNNGVSSSRPSRGDSQGNISNGRENSFPSSGGDRTGIVPPTRGERPSYENNGRPSRVGTPDNNGSSRTERPAQTRETSPVQRPERMQQPPQQREERRVETPREYQPQREAPAQREYQRPQRQESRPQPQPQAQPQYQRPERTQQSAPPSRGVESRGGRGEGGSSGSRPTRGGGR
ncbi:DUF6600 domain-containing protein [Pedobacter africanus]|uniref:YXWGXW repeat-containing protein n=1 Tax=Pedobacter africanus TaxID=151894 RepID=A0A1W2B7M2_9SPHI|nr:DUF6600 domain-containing protein [Pedobacter africanus]SMC68926.1 hypothetical protein SAMN04488524_2021 [Pedobacter africanus]